MAPFNRHYLKSRSFLLSVLSIGFFIVLGLSVVFIPTATVIALIVMLIIAISFWHVQRTLFPIYLLIATSILMAYRLPLGLFNLTPFRAAAVLVAIYVLGNILWLNRTHILRHRIQRINTLLLFVAPFCIVYMLGGFRAFPDPQAIFKLLSFGVTIAILVFFTYYADQLEGFAMIAKGQVSTAVVLAGYGLYELAIQITTGQRPNLPFAEYGFENVVDKRFAAFEASLELIRVESLLNDSNILAIYLSASLLFCIGFFFLDSSGRSRTFYLFSLVVISTCLIFTLSRSAIVGLTVGLTFIIAKYLHLRHKVNYKFLFLVLVILLFGLSIMYFANPIFQEYVSGLVTRFSTVNTDNRRFMLLAGGINLFVQNIVFGTGVGTLELHGLGSHTAHSSYVTILAEAGVIGGLTLVLFILPLVISSTMVFRDRYANHLEIGITASTISLLAFELFYDTLLLAPVSMIILGIGYSHAMWRISRRKQSEMVVHRIT